MPDHPKIQRLKRRLGAFADYAVEAVIRLWGHCQASQRGGTWSQADAEYVEIVTRWKGAPGELYKALREVGLLEEAKGQVLVHDWDSFNSKAKAAWENGRTGGRPPGTENPGQLLLGKPNRNPKRKWVNPKRDSGNPNPISGNQIVSEAVSELGTGTENKNGGAPGAGGSPGGETTAPSGAAVAASRTRFAALTARRKELEAVAEEERSPAERVELRKIGADLEALQRAQAAGRF